MSNTNNKDLRRFDLAAKYCRGGRGRLTQTERVAFLFEEESTSEKVNRQCKGFIKHGKRFT